ncbi:MAG: DUF92 domain-containing protein [Candidatus Caldarchaeum sp.]
MLYRFVEATLVIAAVGLIALGGRFLDKKGVGAAVLIGYCVYVFGGRVYFLILLVFFVVAGFTTKYRYVEKYGEVGRGVRTWSNVFANGLAAALIAFLGLILQADSTPTLAVYLGAVSAVFSDTMSTEIGLLSKKPPRMITSLKPVSPGTPGAVSLPGLLAGFFTGFILVAGVFLYALFFGESFSFTGLIPLSVVAGFTGSLFDSVFGGLFQSRYRCTSCGKTVEVKKHCGKPTTYLSGSRFVNNEIVNLLTSLYGGFVAYSLLPYVS